MVALARNSGTMLNRSGENKDLYLIPNFRGKDFNLLPLSLLLAVGFSYMLFLMVRYAPSTPNLLRIFILSGC